jgi:cobalt-zinc-cadmium efflux system outer membrane protein
MTTTQLILQGILRWQHVREHQRTQIRGPLLLALAAVTAVGVPSAGQAPLAARPLTLRQVFDSVASHHPLVQAAQARVRAARGSSVTAGLLGNPVFTYQVDNAQLPGGPPPDMEREVMITGTLPLEALYQRTPRKRRANSELRAAENEVVVTRQRVALDAARAFYQAAMAQVGVEAAHDLASWLDTVVAYNRNRVREGVTAEADLIRSELERDRTGAEATMQEADAIRSRATLAAYLGDSPVALSNVVVAIEDEPLTFASESIAPTVLVAAGARSVMRKESNDAQDSITAAIVNRALTSRPEMRAARERVAGAGAGIATEHAMLVRQLGLTLGTKQSGGTTSLVAGLSLPFPILDQNRGEIARATAERDAAQFELAAQERTVRAEVSGAYYAARILTDRAKALAQRSNGYLARADEARRIALGAYREGAVPLIQVLDAARAWGDARVAYYRILYAQHESVLELLVAQGDDLLTMPAIRDPKPRE